MIEADSYLAEGYLPRLMGPRELRLFNRQLRAYRAEHAERLRRLEVQHGLELGRGRRMHITASVKTGALGIER